MKTELFSSNLRVRRALQMLLDEAQAVADDHHRPRYARLDEALASVRVTLFETAAPPDEEPKDNFSEWATNTRTVSLMERCTKAEEWRDYYRAKWLGDRAVPQPPVPAPETTQRKPDGYAYRYPDTAGGTYIAFRPRHDRDAQEVIPYFFGTAPKTSPVRVQACRPEDRAMLQTEAGQELLKAATGAMRSEKARGQCQEVWAGMQCGLQAGHGKDHLYRYALKTSTGITCVDCDQPPVEGSLMCARHQFPRNAGT